MPSKTQDVTNNIKLGYIVSEVLELPKENHRWTGPAYKAVRAVFNTITAALQRGEEVKINGFGIFKIRTLPARRQYLSFSINGKVPFTGGYMANLPLRKYVHFQPSKVLLRMLNQDPNAD